MPITKYKYLIVTIIMLQIVGEVLASPFLPAVKYFSAKDVNAGHQNWGASQNVDGVMYFGNNDGLLSYDGYRWKKYSMPKENILRSVMCDGDRVYVGSFEEFGYFIPDECGKLEYKTLSKSIKGAKMNNDEVWKIFKLGNDIYFQSFKGYYRYDGKNVIGYDDKELNPLYFHEFEGKIYAQIINDGLYKLVNGSYVPFLSIKDLRSSVISIQKGRKAHEMLIVTENHGLYYYSPEAGLTRFVTDIDANLMTNHVNRVVMTRDSVLMIGTTIDGLYAVNNEGHCLWHFNRDVRLNNNTVLGLYCDNAHNVWVCMDDGISYIQYNSPITLYSPASSELKFGMVYDVYGVADNIYLATNQGLYKYNSTINQLKIIPNTEAQNWYVTAFDNQIFCGNNFHSMIVKGDVAVANPQTSGSTCIRKCVINGVDLLIESSYTDLHVYRKNAHGEWVFINNVKGLSSPIKDIEVDASGTIWASHMHNGLYKITLNADFTKVAKCKHILKLSENPKRKIIAVIKIHGRIVFIEDDKFYTYDDISRKIIPYEKLNKVLTGVYGVHSAVHVTDNLFWLMSGQEYCLIKYEEDEYKMVTKLPFTVFDNPCLGEEAGVFVRDGRYSYFNLNNSVGCYDCYHKPLKSELSDLKLSSVIAYSNNGQVSLPLNETGDIDSDYREVTIELLFPHYDNIPIKYVYTLSGGGINLKSENYDALIRYSSLVPSKYNFEVVAYDVSNKEVGRLKYKFSIATPFYLTFPAILFYVILLCVIVYVVIKRNTKRLMKLKQKEFEKEQMQQSMRLNEQERLISEQSKLLLESELTIKGKELASMAMGAIAKNSALEELKNVIQQQLLKENCSKKFLTNLLNHINDNIENKEFWEVFQQNFDLIHANFFRNLRKSYPDLTSTDLKFCALIRLNMSTKDIAQMTNLTIRGVEAARYRIRKKLEIPESDSMVNFLIEFR
ncbi:MAG: hypothetical protein RR513_06865 [Muribaculaceae bacterium]